MVTAVRLFNSALTIHVRQALSGTASMVIVQSGSGQDASAIQESRVWLGRPERRHAENTTFSSPDITERCAEATIDVGLTTP